MSQKAEATYHGADIVTRLRALPLYSHDGVLQDAAQEIEKLRARIESFGITLEPTCLQVVDYTVGELGGEDSPYWSKTRNGWKGYKGGGKTYLDWFELSRRWGPLSEVNPR